MQTNLIILKLYERIEVKMFTDYTKIIIKSGDGGNGAATFAVKNM